MFAKTHPFDHAIQVIDGITEVKVDEKSMPLKNGQAMIIPAHSLNNLKAI
jgi:quercetin dioxygenase-like cupin family protein